MLLSFEIDPSIFMSKFYLECLQITPAIQILFEIGVWIYNIIF